MRISRASVSVAMFALAVGAVVPAFSGESASREPSGPVFDATAEATREADPASRNIPVPSRVDILCAGSDLCDPMKLHPARRPAPPRLRVTPPKPDKGYGRHRLAGQSPAGGGRSTGVANGGGEPKTSPARPGTKPDAAAGPTPDSLPDPATPSQQPAKPDAAAPAPQAGACGAMRIHR